MRLLSLYTCYLTLCCLATGAVTAATVRTPHAEAELIAEKTAIEVGRPFTLALRLKAIPGWHTYWRNPGDAGLPTKLTWRLPPGFQPGDIQWPYPARLPALSLVNFGYNNEVVLPVTVQAPAMFEGKGPVVLGVRADWLVCSDENCIPERADLQLRLSVGTGRASSHAPTLRRALARLPVPAATLDRWRFSSARTARGPAIEIVPAPGAAVTALNFFPYEPGKIENSAPQSLERTPKGYRLQLTSAQQPVGQFTRLYGILVIPPHAIEIDLPLARMEKQP